MSIDLSFRPEQINDLLKSMVLQDFGGGRIAPVVFSSRDPIERTLKSFAIDLTDNPPLAQLLNRMRGVKVAIAALNEFQGVIVGVESLRQKVKDEVVETRVLNLLTDQGLRAVPLDQVQQMTILDAPLDAQLRSALKVLGTSHDTQGKTVALSFTGQGKRRVSVSYILEAPIWRGQLPPRPGGCEAAVPARLGDYREHHGRGLESGQSNADLRPPNQFRHGPLPTALRAAPHRGAGDLRSVAAASLRRRRRS